jgi:hypothetical protein
MLLWKLVSLANRFEIELPDSCALKRNYAWHWVPFFFLTTA